MTDTTRLKPYAPLLAIAVAGLALRIFVTFVMHPMCPFELSDVANLDSARQYIVDAGQYGDECFYLRGDALAIYLQGILTSEGNAFGNPFSEIWGQESTILAGKPPVMTLVIAGMNLVGAGDPDAVRLVSALAGAATVFVIGLVAWRMVGRRAGLIAAAIAAAYPMLWINDWRMMPETYLALFTALTLLAAYHFWVRPRPSSAVVLGGAIGLALMARVEMLLLVVVLVLPLCWRLPRRSTMGKVKLGVLSTVATAAVLLPWSVFLVSQYGGTQFLQTGNGTVALNGTCDSTYYGDYLGYLDFGCFDAEAIAAAGAAHGDRTGRCRAGGRPRVPGAGLRLHERASPASRWCWRRAGRLWDVYRPVQNVELNAVLEGRGRVDSWLGLIGYACLVPLAGFGDGRCGDAASRSPPWWRWRWW
ncbi:MAG: glycosyltransferase family 39 protein [Acidimicrobiales bacterium]